MAQPDSLAAKSVASRLMERVHHLAEHVELTLAVGGVADANRRGAVVAGQPRDLPFGQAALAADPVHDLHLLGTAGDRAQQPLSPSLRLVVEAGIHQREQRERRVAQPAEAIVPVSAPAQLLRQRRSGGRNDSAGRPISQRLERDQRAHNGIRAMPGRTALLRPARPERFRLLEHGPYDRAVAAAVRARARRRGRTAPSRPPQP